MTSCFYSIQEPVDIRTGETFPESFRQTFWSPSGWSFVPFGLPPLPCAVWTAFHRFRVFKNRDFSVFVVYDERTLVHRSFVFPGYFRFPFMAREDLQIGDTWTHEAYRGQGIASLAVKRIVQRYGTGSRAIWYVCDEENVGSRRVVEKVGFHRVGEGRRTKRFGVGILGSYVLERM